MRRLAIGVALLSAGCDRVATDSGDRPWGGHEKDRIACAIGPGAAWHEDCLIERQDEGGESFLVLLHPDGGFRRVKLLGDVAIEADGAERAVTRRDGAVLEVTIAEDRYRIPVPQTAGAAGE